MTALQLIQITIGFMKLANWITGYISKEEWKKLGYDQAFLEQVALLQSHSGIAQEAFNAARKATDAQLDVELSK